MQRWILSAVIVFDRLSIRACKTSFQNNSKAVSSAAAIYIWIAATTFSRIDFSSTFEPLFFQLIVDMLLGPFQLRNRQRINKSREECVDFGLGFAVG